MGQDQKEKIHSYSIVQHTIILLQPIYIICHCKNLSFPFLIQIEACICFLALARDSVLSDLVLSPFNLFKLPQVLPKVNNTDLKGNNFGKLLLQ